MGLIKAAAGAIGSTLHDQWKEAIRCEDLGNDILMMKKTTPTGVITNKSTIIVAPGQCAVIFDNGKIIDATAEEGYYTFDTSSSPSFFAGAPARIDELLHLKYSDPPGKTGPNERPLFHP